MNPSSPLVNNFVKTDNGLGKDGVLKLYLIVEAAMGVDRLAVYQDPGVTSKSCLRVIAILLSVGMCTNTFADRVQKFIIFSDRYQALNFSKCVAGPIKSYSGSDAARGPGKKFLQLVEQHDLRLRLLRAADVSVSLVKKYITLLVTHLIIVLQFGQLIDKHLFQIN
ncbi:hypothetical protein EVAR_18893_1 [Eumeta japonica]|uniref:Uncharacterized protein n=1 Tax=Eumeta variegata TaxID=151549 RepID=A0A4C1V1S5_EUMVA|nr:hypothetical protein EVAR_18893_1 [Eumeta japonica]